MRSDARPAGAVTAAQQVREGVRVGDAGERPHAAEWHAGRDTERGSDGRAPGGWWAILDSNQ